MKAFESIGRPDLASRSCLRGMRQHRQPQKLWQMQQFLLLQQDLPEEPLANPPSTMQGPIHVSKVHTHTLV